MNSLAYILCPSYSGSTLLTLLLATHRDIATIGELKATHLGDVAKYSCSCGVPILACPFWEEVGGVMKSHGHVFSPAAFDTHFRAQSWLVDKTLHAGIPRPRLLELRALHRIRDLLELARVVEIQHEQVIQARLHQLVLGLLGALVHWMKLP